MWQRDEQGAYSHMKRDTIEPTNKVFDAAHNYMKIGSDIAISDTGGGMRYVTRWLGGDHSHTEMVLGVPGDAGSPEKLDEPATVTLYFDEEWSLSKALVFEFDEAWQALAFMVGQRAAGLDSVTWGGAK